MSESSRKHKAKAPKNLNFAIIIVSTSRFSSSKEGKNVDDPSGDLIVRMSENFNHKIISRALVPDDQKAIRDAVEKTLGDKNVEAVVVCGGTGIAPKDVTIETVAPILRKILPGFGELFRKLSYESMGLFPSELCEFSIIKSLVSKGNLIGAEDSLQHLLLRGVFMHGRKHSVGGKDDSNVRLG